jgi:pimeloyl-ACP methyl ester carboxylesterase
MAYVQWGDALAPHVVVCVHGLTRQGRDFDTLAQALVAAAQQPLRVICPDVVGRGLSDWLSDPLAYQIPQYASDMAALLSHLHALAPVHTLDWVGTSMGGLIGMVVAGSPDVPKPCTLRRLVLNDVGPVVSWIAIERMKTYVGQTGSFANLQEAADAMWAVSQSFGPHTPEVWRALSAPMVKTLPDGRLTLHYDPAIGVPLRAFTQEQAEAGEATMWQVYDAIQCPTLLVHGAESELLPLSAVMQMQQRGPRAQVASIAGVGHAPTLIHADQIDFVRQFLGLHA